MRKLLNEPTTSSPPCIVRANQVAHQFLVNGRGNMPSTSKRPVIPLEQKEIPPWYTLSVKNIVQEMSGNTKDNKIAGRDVWWSN